MNPWILWWLMVGTRPRRPEPLSFEGNAQHQRALVTVIVGLVDLVDQVSPEYGVQNPINIATNTWDCVAGRKEHATFKVVIRGGGDGKGDAVSMGQGPCPETRLPYRRTQHKLKSTFRKKLSVTFLILRWLPLLIHTYIAVQTSSRGARGLKEGPWRPSPRGRQQGDGPTTGPSLFGSNDPIE